MYIPAGLSHERSHKKVKSEPLVPLLYFFFLKCVVKSLIVFEEHSETC